MSPKLNKKLRQTYIFSDSNSFIFIVGFFLGFVLVAILIHFICLFTFDLNILYYWMENKRIRHKFLILRMPCSTKVVKTQSDVQYYFQNFKFIIELNIKIYYAKNIGEIIYMQYFVFLD